MIQNSRGRIDHSGGRAAEFAGGAGRHTAIFDADGLPGGVYLYRIQAGGGVQTRQVVLAK